MTTLSLIVPCYNEREGLPRLLAVLEQTRRGLGPTYGWELVFVDDGSTDGTAELLEEMCGRSNEARVIHHLQNRGLGAALRTGFQAAKGQLLATIDSDCTYDPQELTQMLKLVEQGADVVVASPYHPQGRVENVPASRLFLSRNLSRLYRWVTGSNLYTYTSLFRLYRAEVVRAIPVDSDGFLALTEILVSALGLGYRVMEHPTRLGARQQGGSKAAIVRLIRDHLGCLARLMWRRVRLLSRLAPSTQPPGLHQPVWLAPNDAHDHPRRTYPTK